MQVPSTSTGFQAPVAPMQNMAPQQQAMPGQQAASYYPNMGNVSYSFKRACNNFWKKKEKKKRKKLWRIMRKVQTRQYLNVTCTLDTTDLTKY